ncbi:hypothetical protein ABZ883_23275 [Streptomyces sp. NPDC046977]|uniref:TRAFAC clade GTPase domain-containing protein n=1 Tax=Streptomyces sp. NPDC046977 TaxID=3154703 RepID=UPI0033D2D530
MSESGRHVLDVGMLGPSGAGKTSLLASMYVQYASVAGATDLDLTPVGETAAKLTDAVSVLESLSRSVQVRGGIEQTTTTDVHRYEIAVGRKGRKARFRMCFTDYAGEVLRDLDAGPVGRKVRASLLNSPVVVLAVDTPALMALDGEYHQRINLPHLMYERIKELLVEDEQRPRLLIIVPLKCERWVATRQGTEALMERVREGYRPLLDYIAHADVRPRVGCVVTPVQTTGSIVFSTIKQTPGGGVQFHYRSRTPGAPYRPVDTDQPLRYALRFVLSEYRRRRGFWREAVDEVFGTDVALQEAVAAFARSGSERDGLHVVQDHPHLSPAAGATGGRG